MVNARSDESALGSRFALRSEEIKMMIEASCWHQRLLTR